MELLYTYWTNDIVSIEKCTHARLKQYKYKKYKQVYQINMNILKQVIQTCGSTGNIKLKKTNKSNLTGGFYMICL